MSNAEVSWGIVGPGEIASVFARGLRTAGAGRVERVYGRSAERRDAFCAAHGGRPASALDELCSDPAIDLVYVASPHPAHAEAARAALEAGKGVLCEKPLTTDRSESAALLELAEARDLPLLEAYMYRAHPQLERLLERVAAGEIGRPLRTESCFTFFAPEDPSHRLLARELGGGGILDVGGYPCSFALAVARACGEESTPILSDVRGHHGPTGVDVEASCVLHFANGLEGHARVSFEQDLTMRASVVGESGTLSLEHPFMPEGRRDGRRGVVVLEREGELQREEVDADADCFGLEARELARLWSTGERHARWPMVDRTQTLQLAELLDSWRASIPAEVVS